MSGGKASTWPDAVETTPLRESKRQRSALNYSQNVLLAYRAGSLKNISTMNFIAAILCLVYCGMNIALLWFNYENHQAVELGEEPPVSQFAFHLSEFWGTFGFALVELFALMQTPKSLISTVNNPRLLKIIVFLNVVFTLIPAILVSVNMERFEIVCHEIEYCSEITMSFVELVLLWSLLRRVRRDDEDTLMIDGDRGSSMIDSASPSLSLSFIALTISLLQLGIYNGLGENKEGDMRGEVSAHYCEFTFQIISSLITFWFTLDNMFIADDELAQILYGNHEDCKVCATHTEPAAATHHGHSHA